MDGTEDHVFNSSTGYEDCDPFSDLPVDELPYPLPDHPIQLDSDEETEVETVDDDSGAMYQYEIGDPDSPGH